MLGGKHDTRPRVLLLLPYQNDKTNITFFFGTWSDTYSAQKHPYIFILESKTPHTSGIRDLVVEYIDSRDASQTYRPWGGGGCGTSTEKRPLFGAYK